MIVVVNEWGEVIGYYDDGTGVPSGGGEGGGGSGVLGDLVALALLVLLLL